MNGVQTGLKCKPNVKRCKRFVFAAHSPLLHPNTLTTKAISHFQADHILTRFVFPPLRFAYKLTTDREEANDLLQETSLKALDNEDKYMPDTNFKGWMYTIMRNIFINNYRKVVRDQTFVDRTDNLYHLNLPQDTGFESTEKAYDLKEMHRVVNSLPKEYRVPFAMHVSGFKYREIAEKLNLPLGTIKSRIFFTRQKLQEELKDFR